VPEQGAAFEHANPFLAPFVAIPYGIELVQAYSDGHVIAPPPSLSYRSPATSQAWLSGFVMGANRVGEIALLARARRALKL
jgi:hypothetical protein